MRRRSSLFTVALLALGAFFLIGATCGPDALLRTTGLLSGRPVVLDVDDAWAHEMITAPEAFPVRALIDRYADRPLNTATLADEVTEGGTIISELGLDHYYKHPDIDRKTIALALVVAG